ETGYLRPSEHNDTAIGRPNRVGIFDLGRLNDLTAIRLNLEQPPAFIAHRADYNPATVRRPGSRSSHVQTLRQGHKPRSIFIHHVEMDFALTAEGDGHSLAVRRNSRRIEQRTFSALPDLEHVIVLEAPETIAPAERRKKKDGSSASDSR